MNKVITYLILCLAPLFTWSQNASLKGIVIEAYSKAPVVYASVMIEGTGLKTITDSLGQYELKNIPAQNYIVRFTKPGYFTAERLIEFKGDEVLKPLVYLTPEMIELKAAEISSISATSASSSSVISAMDMELRPCNSAQDLLKSVPGIFTAQHQGGAKAEQIFVRGFDCDHGTDINLTLDGVPINLPSHAHGQGYADMHFLIADVVSSLDVYKGPF